MFILLMVPSASCFRPVHIELFTDNKFEKMNLQPRRRVESRSTPPRKHIEFTTDQNQPIRISHRTRITVTYNQDSQGSCQAHAKYGQNCLLNCLDSREKSLTVPPELLEII